MFLFYYCEPITKYTFNEKIDIQKKMKYIQLFSLINKGIMKEYYIKYIHIINNNFYCETDISYEYKDGFLIHSLKREIIPYFHFYESDIEYNYILYENNINNIHIRLKIFNDYMTLEFETHSINDFFDFIKQNKYIL